MWRTNTKTVGFTIVELLIVIVVIAILAAITVVAYTGIQDRAKTSATQSATRQAVTKVQAYAVENTELYPANEANFFAATALADTSDIDYTYLASSDRKEYCVSATNNSNRKISSAASSASGGVVEGKCTVNLVTNPSFEDSLAGWNLEGNVTTTWDTSNYVNGVRSVRIAKLASGSSGNAIYEDVPLETGKTYTFGFSVKRSAGSGDFLIGLRDANGSSYLATTGYVTPPSSMTHYEYELTPLTTGNARIFLRTGTGAVGDAISVDAIYVIEGGSPNTGDESLQTWARNGLFGPAKRL